MKLANQTYPSTLTQPVFTFLHMTVILGFDWSLLTPLTTTIILSDVLFSWVFLVPVKIEYFSVSILKVNFHVLFQGQVDPY